MLSDAPVRLLARGMPWLQQARVYSFGGQRMRLLRSTLVLGLVCLAPLAAQVTGRLTGRVIDASGAAIPGVGVKLLLAGQSKPILRAVTTSDGLFNLSGIRPEIYDV